MRLSSVYAGFRTGPVKRRFEVVDQADAGIDAGVIDATVVGLGPFDRQIAPRDARRHPGSLSRTASPLEKITKSFRPNFEGSTGLPGGRSSDRKRYCGWRALSLTIRDVQTSMQKRGWKVSTSPTATSASSGGEASSSARAGKAARTDKTPPKMKAGDEKSRMRVGNGIPTAASCRKAGLLP